MRHHFKMKMIWVWANHIYIADSHSEWILISIRFYIIFNKHKILGRRLTKNGYTLKWKPCAITRSSRPPHFCVIHIMLWLHYSIYYYNIVINIFIHLFSSLIFKSLVNYGTISWKVAHNINNYLHFKYIFWEQQNNYNDLVSCDESEEN